jgi:hypothetical protein
MIAFRETPSHTAAYLIAHAVIWGAGLFWHLVSPQVTHPIALVAAGVLTGVLLSHAVAAVRKRLDEHRRRTVDQNELRDRLRAIERRLDRLPGHHR